MRPASLLIAAAGVLAIAATGCGTKTLNDGELQDELVKQLAPQGGVDPKDISVACPDDQEVKKGRTFDCELTAPDGSKAKIVVTLTNDDGGFTATVPEQQFK
jgi:uncharacterized protein DUF4333